MEFEMLGQRYRAFARPERHPIPLTIFQAFETRGGTVWIEKAIVSCKHDLDGLLIPDGDTEIKYPASPTWHLNDNFASYGIETCEIRELAQRLVLLIF
ncbi:hypothetical protein K8I61_17175 [bacterium]|nr:hypothetical protein [bacterium]